MLDNETLGAILTELDGIANAPMTADQRLARAAPVLTSRGVAVSDLTAALGRTDLPWNASKASEVVISAEVWQESMRLASVPSSSDLATLLDSLHRAESAAIMLRSGYAASMDEAGNLRWTR